MQYSHSHAVHLFVDPWSVLSPFWRTVFRPLYLPLICSIRGHFWVTWCGSELAWWNIVSSFFSLFSNFSYLPFSSFILLCFPIELFFLLLLLLMMETNLFLHIHLNLNLQCFILNLRHFVILAYTRIPRLPYILLQLCKLYVHCKHASSLFPSPVSLY